MQCSVLQNSAVESKSVRHLMLSLASSMVLLKEQSLPPNPLLQVQDTEQRTSKIEQIGRILPDGSEYLHAPFEEQIVPVIENRLGLGLG